MYVTSCDSYWVIALQFPSVYLEFCVSKRNYPKFHLRNLEMCLYNYLIMYLFRSDNFIVLQL